MIVDLGVRHDTRCEKYGNLGKQTDTITNDETVVGVLLDSNITLSSANQIRGPERTVVYIYIYIYI